MMVSSELAEAQSSVDPDPLEQTSMTARLFWADACWIGTCCPDVLTDPGSAALFANRGGVVLRPSPEPPAASLDWVDDFSAIGVTPGTLVKLDFERGTNFRLFALSSGSSSRARLPRLFAGGGGGVRSSLNTIKRERSFPFMELHVLRALSRSCWVRRCLKPFIESTNVMNLVPPSFVPTLKTLTHNKLNFSND